MQWFYSKTLTDRFFRLPGNKVEMGTRGSGRITSAVPFCNYSNFSNGFAPVAYTAASIAIGGRKFLAVGCSTGVYVAHKGLEGMCHPSFQACRSLTYLPRP